MTAPGISTHLWFNAEADAAARLYVSLFPDAQITGVIRSQTATGADGPPFIVEFTLQGQRYTAMNGGPMYKLSEAVSIAVQVDTQDEVDRLWSALTADGGEESRCGWLKDRFGLSWQIIPRYLTQAISAGGPASGRVVQAMMAMRKIDIAALQAAAAG